MRALFIKNPNPADRYQRKNRKEALTFNVEAFFMTVSLEEEMIMNLEKRMVVNKLA